MIKHKKRWSRLGLSLAFGGAAVLVGCGDNAGPVKGADAGVVTADAGDGGETGEMVEAGGHDMDALAVEKRVAFMAGHVAAGLALYRAGAPDQAAPHLLHPVSETHADERAGIDALGFDGAVFEEVSAALEQGRPASEIEPQLQAAEANIRLVQKNAGGDAAELVSYLMDTVVEEYLVGVNDGAITDAGEYQDAYGFSVVALRIAREADLSNEILSELMGLIDMWPEAGPLADTDPMPTTQVIAQTSRVQLLLN